MTKTLGIHRAPFQNEACIQGRGKKIRRSIVQRSSRGCFPSSPRDSQHDLENRDKGTGLVDAVRWSPRIKRVQRATSYVQNALPVLINPHSTHEPCHIIRISQPRDPKQKAWMTRPKTQKQPASEWGSAGDSGGVQTGNIFTSLIKYNSVNFVWDGFILKTYFLGRWIVRQGKKKKKDSNMDQKIWQTAPLVSLRTPFFSWWLY